ncbi:MAG: hypothetical protein QOD30_2001 [Actinomycetota bacterium]|jgi:hypothetical protein|nr:hypothetical protein [Actinomycetota bacterium]
MWSYLDSVHGAAWCCGAGQVGHEARFRIQLSSLG